MENVLLGLGSNLGNRAENITKALKLLKANELITIKKISSFIETKAISEIKQPNFINAAVLIETILSPDELLDFTEEIEKIMGRKHKNNYLPRIIDIDILLYGQDIICFKNLTIPHPLMHERAFVLTPLKEISPNFIHPILQEPITSLYNRVVGY
ncbi:MAG: 2-amino-4-hydroxy-6-hydroxymethyldihydropteridine diphosphokinase [Candidatus Margulisiibacteriota bacterium]|jgi:2-amino-4-hydroxy-6-hydroxymethyldihydropteridine diphosphokinase